ncbi:DNA-directed RNA polymerase II subunit 1 [Eurytemora carolleeae]|uniref:DNA-directed RNA polymerase II subunit 1 n=1 Tax=Eurytemora carolleeae TaxID=1294199 RepID=UPI000C76F6A0|nr:DNA-directed RNA polymerase II subunit 1 [Eurytemora carolleeae]|eukprot:XP_023334265.1 DNA-directed RNA polymerase II subunit 1-like [Eurytemora affinis]
MSVRVCKNSQETKIRTIHPKDEKKMKRGMIFHPTLGYAIPPPIPVSVARRNARERSRVKTVNGGFECLRQHVPAAARAKKISKVDILKHSVSYIRNLQNILDGYQSFTSNLSSTKEHSSDRNSGKGSDSDPSSSLGEALSAADIFASLEESWTEENTRSPSPALSSSSSAPFLTQTLMSSLPSNLTLTSPTPLAQGYEPSSEPTTPTSPDASMFECESGYGSPTIYASPSYHQSPTYTRSNSVLSTQLRSSQSFSAISPALATRPISGRNSCEFQQNSGLNQNSPSYYQNSNAYGLNCNLGDKSYSSIQLHPSTSSISPAPYNGMETNPSKTYPGQSNYKTSALPLNKHFRSNTLDNSIRLPVSSVNCNQPSPLLPSSLPPTSSPLHPPSSLHLPPPLHLPAPLPSHLPHKRPSLQLEGLEVDEDDLLDAIAEWQQS